jgi:hypothetical protein
MNAISIQCKQRRNKINCFNMKSQLTFSRCVMKKRKTQRAEPTTMWRRVVSSVTTSQMARSSSAPLRMVRSEETRMMQLNAVRALATAPSAGGNLELVKQLRARTQAGILNCKKALEVRWIAAAPRQHQKNTRD